MAFDHKDVERIAKDNPQRYAMHQNAFTAYFKADELLIKHGDTMSYDRKQEILAERKAARDLVKVNDAKFEEMFTAYKSFLPDAKKSAEEALATAKAATALEQFKDGQIEAMMTARGVGSIVDQLDKANPSLSPDSMTIGLEDTILGNEEKAYAAIRIAFPPGPAEELVNDLQGKDHDKRKEAIAKVKKAQTVLKKVHKQRQEFIGGMEDFKVNLLTEYPHEAVKTIMEQVNARPWESLAMFGALIGGIYVANQAAGDLIPSTAIFGAGMTGVALLAADMGYSYMNEEQNKLSDLYIREKENAVYGKTISQFSKNISKLTEGDQSAFNALMKIGGARLDAVRWAYEGSEESGEIDPKSLFIDSEESYDPKEFAGISRKGLRKGLSAVFFDLGVQKGGSASNPDRAAVTSLGFEHFKQYDQNQSMVTWLAGQKHGFNTLRGGSPAASPGGSGGHLDREKREGLSIANSIENTVFKSASAPVKVKFLGGDKGDLYSFNGHRLHVEVTRDKTSHAVSYKIYEDGNENGGNPLAIYIDALTHVTPDVPTMDKLIKDIEDDMTMWFHDAKGHSPTAGLLYNIAKERWEVTGTGSKHYENLTGRPLVLVFSEDVDGNFTLTHADASGKTVEVDGGGYNDLEEAVAEMEMEAVKEELTHASIGYLLPDDFKYVLENSPIGAYATVAANGAMAGVVAGDTKISMRYGANSGKMGELYFRSGALVAAKLDTDAQLDDHWRDRADEEFEGFYGEGTIYGKIEVLEAQFAAASSTGSTSDWELFKGAVRDEIGSSPQFAKIKADLKRAAVAAMYASLKGMPSEAQWRTERAAALAVAETYIGDLKVETYPVAGGGTEVRIVPSATAVAGSDNPDIVEAGRGLTGAAKISAEVAAANSLIDEAFAGANGLDSYAGSWLLEGTVANPPLFTAMLEARVQRLKAAAGSGTPTVASLTTAVDDAITEARMYASLIGPGSASPTNLEIAMGLLEVKELDNSLWGAAALAMPGGKSPWIDASKEVRHWLTGHYSTAGALNIEDARVFQELLQMFYEDAAYSTETGVTLAAWNTRSTRGGLNVPTQVRLGLMHGTGTASVGPAVASRYARYWIYSAKTKLIPSSGFLPGTDGAFINRDNLSAARNELDKTLDFMSWVNDGMPDPGYVAENDPAITMSITERAERQRIREEFMDNFDVGGDLDIAGWDAFSWGWASNFKAHAMERMLTIVEMKNAAKTNAGLRKELDDYKQFLLLEKAYYGLIIRKDLSRTETNGSRSLLTIMSGGGATAGGILGGIFGAGVGAIPGAFAGYYLGKGVDGVDTWATGVKPMSIGLKSGEFFYTQLQNEMDKIFKAQWNVIPHNPVLYRNELEAHLKGMIKAAADHDSTYYDIGPVSIDLGPGSDPF